MLETKAVTNGPLARRLHGTCHRPRPWLISVSLDLVDFVSLTRTTDCATSFLLAASNVFLIGLFAFAYSRCAKALFLVLIVASACFVYMNLFSVVVLLFATSHVRLFQPPVMRALYVLEMFAGPVAVILWSIGTFLMVRLVVSQSGGLRAGLTNRSSQPPTG